MESSELPEWKRRALADPEVTDKQARIIMDGAQSLSEAWFLGAMLLKHGR